jgi:hypothetical protein
MVFHKSVYTFLNRRGSVISGPIDLKPIPVNLPGHFVSTSLQFILRAPEIIWTMSVWNQELQNLLAQNQNLIVNTNENASSSVILSLTALKPILL